MKRLIILGTVVMVSVGLYFVGCSVDSPVDTESGSGKTEPAPLFSSTEFNTVLVPDGDVPEWGWIPIPSPPWTRYDKIDEGTDSLDLEIIYTQWVNIWDRFTFTDISGYDDIDASEIVFTIPLSISVMWSTVPMSGLEFWYYIDDTEEGYAKLEYWDTGDHGCDTVWVITFDDVCYDLDDINSLEVKINSIGMWWDPDDVQMIVFAIDADVKYDTLCTPEIVLLMSNRVGNTVTVTWYTDCTSTSKVIWGYSEDALTNTATGEDGTNHSVSFTVGSTEGCVYYRAISEGLTCSAPADTSSTETNVKDVVISNVSRTFDPFNCEFVVSWTTNVKSSSKVYYGSSCLLLPNTKTGPGDTTSHTVRIDASGYPLKYRMYTKPESSSGCDTAQGDCDVTVRDYCFGS
jgi:hypothetical protein